MEASNLDVTIGGMVGDVLEIILVTSSLYAVARKLQVGGDTPNL